MRYEFVLNAVPVAKARPRFAKTGHCYTTEKTASFEDQVFFAARKAGVKPAIKQVSVALTTNFHIPFPKSMPKKRREYALPAVRPDLDNYVKSVMDGLNRVAWDDDAQVVSIHATKCYASFGYVHIIIEHLDYGVSL